MDRLPSAATDEAERVDGLNRGETLVGEEGENVIGRRPQVEDI